MIKKILIIEDDLSIAEIERDLLVNNGYAVTIAADGKKGLFEASSGVYDLIILDVLLPDTDGFDICKQIRGAVDVPILMVTAKTEEIDKIRGFGLGADDYITKPFSLLELVARVRANLSQYERLKSGSISNREIKELLIGNIRLNRQARRVYVGGREVELKSREFDLLCFLMTNPEIVFKKEQLYEEVWGLDASGDERTVAVHINRLREKVETDPSAPSYIQTVWGAGYRFRT